MAEIHVEYEVEREGEVRVCPLRLAAFEAVRLHEFASHSNRLNMTACLREQCAWWRDWHELCAMASVADNIGRIAERTVDGW